MYKKQEMKTKSFQKIQSLFDEEIDQLNNLISSMKEPRNHSSHPNAYQVNLYLFSHSKEIKKGLNKVLKKLDKLLVIKEKDFSREIEKRNTWVEKKFSEVLPINVETEVVVCIV
ncbi:hypothetical protein [Exiguobacterium sp. s28]|uniref:hypothetical protein n=1 Tax=Exiguobacterium sp. s28 TaxID=2751238 RepID=UPI001BE5368F|nr:hypothetical protein [Exiguobacterium sp. s28]